MLDNGVPKTLGLKSIISKYIDHQKEVIVRRTKYDLAAAEAEAHIREGYLKALDNLDEVISIIRNSQDDEEAKATLMDRFAFTEIQVDKILELRLRRLTGMEREKIQAEYDQLLKDIAYYKEILASEQMVLDIVKQEMLEIKNKYADERRTEIDMTAIDYIDDESLIPQEDIVITLTEKGYIKRITADTYKSQNRGGVGVKGMSTNEEDYVKYLINCSTHDDVLFLTSKGKVYRIRGYEVPLYSRQSKGLPIINLIQIDRDETISSIVTINPSTVNEEKKYLVFATKLGLIKKTPLEEFENIRQSGKIAISLREDDELISAHLTNGEEFIVIGSSTGRMVIFPEDEVRPMGRGASGVKAIQLDDSYCIGMEVGMPTDNVLIVTDKGYGKKTYLSEYRLTKRGSKGVKALNTTDKNGVMVAHKIVTDDQDLIIITNSGMVIRMGIEKINQLGRVTQGVKLINLKDGQEVSTITVVDKTPDEEITEEEDIVVEESPVEEVNEAQ